LCSVLFFGLCQCTREKSDDSKMELELLVTQIPVSEYGLHCKLPTLPVPIEPPPVAVPEIFVPRGSTNLALNQKVSCSEMESRFVARQSLRLVTDGEKSQAEGTFLELGISDSIWQKPGQSNPTWVQVDLGSNCTIYAIWFWHFWSPKNSPIVYNDVIVQVALDPAFKDEFVTVYNNDFDNSMGFGVGKDLPYQEIEFGKAIKCDGLSARYVRIYTRGSSWTHLTRFVEVEVYGFRARNHSPANKP
jgi:hypothetical protein